MESKKKPLPRAAASFVLIDDLICFLIGDKLLILLKYRRSPKICFVLYQDCLDN